MSKYNGTGERSLQLDMWGDEVDLRRDNLSQIVVPCRTMDAHPLDVRIMLSELLESHGFDGNSHTSAYAPGWYAIAVFKSEWAAENINAEPHYDQVMSCFRHIKSLAGITADERRELTQMAVQTGILEPGQMGRIEWSISTVHPQHPIRETNAHWDKVMLKLETYHVVFEVESMLIERYGGYPYRYLCGDRTRINEYMRYKKSHV